MKFLFRVSRGEREIKSSYFSRIEIEISQKDVLVTCKLHFFKTPLLQNPGVPKMNENFSFKLWEIEGRKRIFFPLSKIEEREMKILIFLNLENRE